MHAACSFGHLRTYSIRMQLATHTTACQLSAYAAALVWLRSRLAQQLHRCLAQ
jgi:hypothetical protein